MSRDEGSSTGVGVAAPSHRSGATSRAGTGRHDHVEVPQSIAELRALLFTPDGLAGRGWSQRGFRWTCSHGQIHRVRRGWYVYSSDWDALQPEARHLLHVIAVGEDARGGSPVFSHLSAAVVHGLPLYRLTPTRAHVTVPLPNKHSSSSDVVRHEAKLNERDIVVRDGIRCTSIERTVFDVARTVPMEPALVVADAALRTVAVDRRIQSEELAESWRQDLRDRAGRAAGARGIRSVLPVAEFADGRSESPGESVSRLQLVRIGFATPRLQVRVPGPADRDYWVDFALDDVLAFGEFDGKGKYLDEALRSGRSLEQTMLDEKVREDWIRGTTNRRYPRWGSEHIRTPEALAARLAAFGIRPPS